MAFGEMFFGGMCVSCKKGAAQWLCTTCWLALTPSTFNDELLGLASCRGAFAYDGVARQLVTAFKYRRARSLVKWLGLVLAEHLPIEAELITWAPTTKAHRRHRGFDQAELLAKELAQRTGRPCVELLERKTSVSQTGNNRAHRLQAPAFAQRSGASDTLQQLHHAVIVDDVLTTGATLVAAAQALQLGEAKPVVHGLVLAVTPDHPSGDSSLTSPKVAQHAGG